MKIIIPSATPPWTKIGKFLESKCRKAIYTYSMIKSKKLAVALSGGKDSLTMLFLLKAISGRGISPFSIYAIHVEGEFSCGASIDKNYLHAICKKLDIPLIIKKSKQKKDNLECYSCARERRKALFEAMRENDIKTIALGHHRDDGNQTLLLNLFHKGEFASMLPKLYMHHFDITIIRPLIFISEDEILQFAQKYNFLRQRCNCPIGQNSYRHKIKKLIDEISLLFPNIHQNLASSSKLYGSQKASNPITRKQANVENKALSDIKSQLIQAIKRP
jgi:tRNA 2-thiocytidine biosynthesis protein TtcA